MTNVGIVEGVAALCSSAIVVVLGFDYNRKMSINKTLHFEASRNECFAKCWMTNNSLHSFLVFLSLIILD